eukprot:RCo041241
MSRWVFTALCSRQNACVLPRASCRRIALGLSQRGLLIDRAPKERQQQVGQSQVVRVLVPHQRIPDDGNQFAHHPHDGETRGREHSAAVPACPRDRHPDNGRQRKEEPRLPREGHRREAFQLPTSNHHCDHDGYTQQVGVVDMTGRAIQLQRGHHLLPKANQEAQERQVNEAPGVRSKPQSAVRPVHLHEPHPAHTDQHQGERGPPRGQSAAQEGPVKHGDYQGAAAPEQDHRVYPAVLQRPHVGVGVGGEGHVVHHVGTDLRPSQGVQLKQTPGLKQVQHRHAEHELNQRDGGGKGKEVQGELVDQ